MNIALLLSMAAEGLPERTAVGSREGGMTYAELLDQSRRASGWLQQSHGDRVVLVDVNSEAVPVLLFGSALAGKPFVPINFRLADDRLSAIVARTAPSTALVDRPVLRRIDEVEGVRVVSRQSMLADLPADVQADGPPMAASDVAVLLFTSGTTGEPKGAVLRHQNLFSYVAGSVEFMGAGADECTLVSVPAYHIAGISAVLSSVFTGRRLFYLEQFDPRAWVEAARDERVTHAMLVPTMLVRILDVLEDQGTELPALRHISYGGGRMPGPVIERALNRLPHVDFVNAYGLTETSSTIAVLTPEDHRAALTSPDEGERRRLGSVGRPLASIDLEIRDLDGTPVPAGLSGEIWVRGDQVSGEYVGQAAGLSDGWFGTKDSGWLDSGGYLYIEGRLDDVIVRGGENTSPGEIEDVVLQHSGVREVAVFGVPDVEWGETIAAAVVLKEGRSEVTADDLRDWVRGRLRSSKVPTVIEFREALPHTETGKLLRRELKLECAP